MTIFVKTFFVNIIENYFTNLSDFQKQQFSQLQHIYEYWNEKVNLISRKDIKFLYTRHVLHSLAISKIVKFKNQSSILDVGTGGGFPGIPLAILFPKSKFHLIDRTYKKVKVVSSICEDLNLKNVKVEQICASEVESLYDFVVSRAVTKMQNFANMVKFNFEPESKNEIKNGILYLKGGNLNRELNSFSNAKVFELKDFFSDSFFETKKLVHIPF
tara:strand:+ start:18838 stop:19482 length:645 start_codon:yes stop_codon:yes gene_type:complete